MTHTHTKIRQGLLLATAVAALALTAIAAGRLVAATASLVTASSAGSTPSPPVYVRSGPEQSMPSGPSQLGREGRARWQRFHEEHPGVSFDQWWNSGRPAGLTANHSTDEQCQDMCPLRLASGSVAAR